MGNRGCLHDDFKQIRRRFAGKRWIICVLEFKGRRQRIMVPGHYTQVFFLDEATALAAGHRPCAECQRDRFNLFRETWAKANPRLTRAHRPAATDMDEVLHEERTAADGRAGCSCPAPETLPDGTFVTDDGKTAYLVLGKRLLRWTPFGYECAARHGHSPVRVLTPASVVRALKAGYPVSIHPSAFDDFRRSRNVHFSGPV
jgi:hypothetical protein